MKTAELDNNIKNILLRHLQKCFRYTNSSKITYDIHDNINDTAVKSIINLAVSEFMKLGLYVHHDRGEIIYEKYEEQNTQNAQKIQCDNDLYYFQKYHTCIFILQIDEKNEDFFNVYSKYDIEKVRFPLLSFLCGIELKQTVEHVLAKESTIYIFKGDLYYQDLYKKDNLVRIIVRMESL